MSSKRITASAALLLTLVVPVLVLACSAEKVDLPTQPDIPGVDFPVAAAIACAVFTDQPGVISFEDHSTGAPTSWSWDFGDGRTSTAQHPKHQYAQPGAYVVRLTVRDARTSDTHPVVAVTDQGCTVETCGNGIVDVDGEQCDDGNNVSGDGCSGLCQEEASFCGDGIVAPGEEQCDDGNIISNDGCSEDCRVEFCGDGVTQLGEQCDDGNSLNGDGCENNCTIT